MMPRSRFDVAHPAARARALTVHAAHRAARARIELLIVVPLIAIVLLANEHRQDIFGLDLPVRVLTAITLLILGWRLARDVGRTAAPVLFRRLDPATAGTVGFLIRLAFLVAAALAALRIAGLEPRTLAVSGAIVAVVFGLASQQTLGNLIAGVVLISARPFRVGDRVRLQSGGLAGEVEGIVTALGLLYTTFARGDDSIMVPNNIVLGSAVVPLREPSSVDLRARLRPDVKPSEVQELLEEGIRTPVRAEPHIGLEEIDAEELVVRIEATPASEADGPRLADEILSAIAPVTREGLTEEREAARFDARAPGPDGEAPRRGDDRAAARSGGSRPHDDAP
jgi:small conductance mechanosensitive channel